MSRRTLFQMGGAAAGIAILAACGDDKKASDATPAGGTAAGGTTAGTTAPATVAPRRLVPSDVGDSGTGLGVATGDYSRVTNKSSGSLNMYTWGAYNDPDIVGSLAESRPRRQDAGQLLHQQRRPHHQAAGIEGHQRVRHRRARPGHTSRR